MTQACQTTALHEHGFNVRTTFIDGPAEWFDVSGSARRAHSSPPASGAREEPRGGRPVLPVPKAGQGAKPKDCSPSVASGASTAYASPSQQSEAAHPSSARAGPVPDLPSEGGLWCIPRGGRPVLPVPKTGQGAKVRDGSPSAASEASTAYASPSQQSEAADPGSARAGPVLNLPNEGDLWWLSAESARECKDKALELVDAVERGCGFMRLNGHGLHAYSSEKARRRGVAMNVRFYVRGLPSAKRAKWQQPLCWSAAAVLQSLGLDVRMQGGELHVPVRRGHPGRGPCQEPEEDGILIRLEFVAGRL